MATSWYRNEEMPAQVPKGAMGRIPVILRLVLDEQSEEWWPGHAIRWTQGHVLVAWQQTPGDSATVKHLWLRAEDVKRKIARPSSDVGPGRTTTGEAEPPRRRRKRPPSGYTP